MEAQRTSGTEAKRRDELEAFLAACNGLEPFLAAFGTEPTQLVDRSSPVPHKDAGVTPAAVTAPTVVQSKMVVPTPTPTAGKPVMTTVEGQATPSGNQASAKLELLCSIPLAKLPGIVAKPAAVPVEAKAIAETEASAKTTPTEVGVDAVAGTVLCYFHKKFGAKAWLCGKAYRSNRGKRCDWVRMQMTLAEPSIEWSERDHSRSHKRPKSRDRSNSRDHSRSHKRPRSKDRSNPQDLSKSHKRLKSRDRSNSRDRSRSHRRPKSRDRSISRDRSRSHRRPKSRERSKPRNCSSGNQATPGGNQATPISLGNGNPSKGAKSPRDGTVGDIQRGLDTVEVMPLSGSSLDPRKKGPTLLSISQPIDIYEQKPWLGGIWLSSLPEAPGVAQSPTQAPSSSSQHLHRQVGNGSLPPSAPKTPPKTSFTGNESLPPSAPKTPPTYTQVQAPVQGLAPSQTEVDILPTSPPDETVTDLVFRLPFGWKKTGTRRSAAATPNVRAVWDWNLFSPSGKRLQSRCRLLQFLANNPEVPIDSSVTHHGCPWNKSFRRKSSDLEVGRGVGRAQKKLPRLNLFK